MSLVTENCESDATILHKRLDDCSVCEKKVKSSTLEMGSNACDVEIIKMNKSTAKMDFEFDTVIGHIEDMLIDDEFHELQINFLEKYWREFNDNEENKHEYMEIFMEYTNEIESFINKYLKKVMPEFEMEMLTTELETRKNSLDGEVFEVLFTLTDFSIFKEMFLDYRLMKEGNIVDVGQSLYVSPIQ